MSFKRKIFNQLQLHLEKKQITVLTGMRRTGKTTLVKQLMEVSKIEQKLFFDLEKIENRQLFNYENYDDTINILSQQGIDFSKKVLLCLDEIQLLQNIVSVIKYLYDHYDIKFIITGSSSYYLKNKFQESLAGRKRIFDIYPLDFGEYLIFNEIKFKSNETLSEIKFSETEFKRLSVHYEQFINFGGFPEVVLTPNNDDKIELIKDIINSYINIDLVQLSDIRKINDLNQLIYLLAARVGSKIDISKLASATKLARQTVENYIYVLENTYFLKTIPVFSNNPDREIVKSKKLYFLDNGILNVLADLSSGSKFENAMYNQLSHLGNISYYQLKTGQEIDFILNKKIAVEVKETPYYNDLNKTMRLAKNMDISEGYVVYKNFIEELPNNIWGGMIR